MNNMLSHQVYEHPTSDQWVTFVHGAGGSSTIWFKQIPEFKKYFNVLVLDLRGHGNSKSGFSKDIDINYTFSEVTNDIVKLIDYLKIKSSHFVGISLGTIMIRELAEYHPDRVKSMIMAGAILKFNLRSKFLLKMGMTLKSIMPYMVLYKLFAFIIMPKKNHKRSRSLFVKEAKRMCQKEFIRWFNLTSEIIMSLKIFRVKPVDIPTFYVMGEQDYLFLPSVKEVVKSHKNTSLDVIKDCGHVVNVEYPFVFNSKAISFIKGLI